jgi:oligosaccharide repeat unit polymerase
MVGVAGEIVGAPAPDSNPGKHLGVRGKTTYGRAREKALGSSMRSDGGTTGALSSREARICAAVQMVVFAGALGCLLVPTATTADRISVDMCCVLLFVHSLWSIWSWRRVCGTLFDPYVLFLFSATLFNAGLALLYVLHLNNEPVLDGFPSDIVIRSLLLVFAALAGLHFGALIAALPARAPPPAEPASASTASRMTGLTVLAISAVPLLLQLRHIVGVAVAGGYMALYQQDFGSAGASSAQSIGADLVMPGAYFLLAGSAQHRRCRIAAIAILSVYCFTLLFVGYRGHSVMPLVSMAWLWECTIRRISRAHVAIAAAILLCGVFPFIRATRELWPVAERTSATAVESYSEMEDHPAVATFSEMGGSISTVAYTVELVPKYRAYDDGVGYAYALLTVVPSLFWDRHPSVARGAPSAWLIETIDPYTAAQGGSIGYSFVADAFLNFGPLGVPLFSLFLGWAIVRFWRWADGRVGRLAVVATFVPHLLFSARAEIDVLPRPLVWYGFVPYALYLLIRRSLEERSVSSVAGRAV